MSQHTNTMSSVETYIALLSKVEQKYPNFCNTMSLRELRAEFGSETFPEWLDTIYIGEEPDIPLGSQKYPRYNQNPKFWLITEYHCYPHYFSPTNAPGLWAVEYLLTNYPDKFGEIMSYFRAYSDMSEYSKEEPLFIESNYRQVPTSQLTY
jgi:hypothetical protein